MTSRRIAGAIASLALVLAACGGTTATTAPTQAATTQAPAATARVVNLEIGDGSITPASVTVKKGETVTFIAKNVNTVEVELIVGLKTDVDADSGDSLKEAEEIAPGTTKTVTYTFDGAGPYAFGDQLEDHYAKGAKGVIVVEP